ncbi:MAG TPA: hypothetical protein VFV82_09045, partial [Candidatus Binatia bacterium]|nr:hypothetical protein [Candidatus Binatia bacterium]
RPHPGTAPALETAQNPPTSGDSNFDWSTTAALRFHRVGTHLGILWENSAGATTLVLERR